MKKKFIPGLLLLTLTAGGFSTLTSCKDTDEDLRTELQGQDQAIKAELLQKIKAALGEAKDYTDSRINGLYIPSDEDIKSAANEVLTGWITGTGAESLNASVKAIIDEMIENGQLGIGSGSSCDCQLKDLTEEQATTLIAIIEQAKNLIGDNLDGKGGLLSKVPELENTINDLSSSMRDLDGIINGKGGVVNQVNGLQEWFDGIGMTPEQFRENVKQGAWVKAHQGALEKIEEKKAEIALLNKDAIEALNKVSANLAGINEMYTSIFQNAQLPEGETAWWNYGQVMKNIQDNSKAISILQNEVDEIFGRINGMVTGLLLQAATNNVFPSFNTPFGVNSMVLMTYFGDLATQAQAFPISNASDMGAECRGDVNIDWSKITSASTPLNTTIAHLNDDGLATLGNLWFTVNPGTVNTVDKNGFALVNSREEVSKVVLNNVVKDDETLIKFGVNSTRAAGNGNGLYRADAAVALSDLDNIKVNIEPGLVESLKDAVKNHTAADMLHMFKQIYNQLNNICDMNALRYTYETVTGKNQAKDMSKVYSNYAIAATAFKPLSFATLKGTSIRHLPTINPIEIDKSLVDLNLKPFEIGDVSLDVELDLGQIEFSPVGETIIEVKVPSHFNENGDADAWTTEKVNITKDLQEVVDKLQASVSEWFNGKNPGDPTLNEKLQSQIQAAVDTAFNGENGLIKNIENQVNDMMGQIQDKLDGLVDDINKDYLSKVNKLIEKYNSVADRINKALDDPNHYLQTVMFVRNANGGLNFLSTNAKQPNQFKGNGEAIELWATTYNFETVCPVYKKIVGVVKVTDQNGNERTDLKNAANASMAKVVNGDANRFALDVKGATNGVYTYEIAYQALDYTGHTSTIKTYLQVVRK